RLLAAVAAELPTIEGRAWRAATTLWIGGYALFSARAAAIGAVAPGSNPWPAEHAVVRLGLCGFGAILCCGMHQALNCGRYKSAAVRWNAAAVLAASGAALSLLLSVAACRWAFGIAACAREIAHSAFLYVLIFAGWCIYSVAPSPSGLREDNAAPGAVSSDRALWVHERGRRYRIPAL